MRFLTYNIKTNILFNLIKQNNYIIMTKNA